MSGDRLGEKQESVELDHDTEVAVEFRNEIRELCDEYHDKGLPRAIMAMLLGFEESSQQGKAEQDDLSGPLYKLSWDVFRAAKEAKEEHDIPTMHVSAEVRQVAECFRSLDRETRRSGDADE